MATYYSPKIITDGLVFCIDAGNPKSYGNPSGGVSAYDLVNFPNSSTYQTGWIGSRNANNIVDNVACFNIDPGLGTGGISFPISPSAAYTFGNDHTIITWARVRNNSGAYRMLLQTNPDISLLYMYPIAVLTSANTLGFAGNSGFVSCNLNVSTMGVITKWAMYTLVGTGGTSSKIYVNGTTFIGSTVSGNATGRSLYTWGNTAADSGPFGHVCSLMAYNRALSETEINNVYQETRSRFRV